MAIIARFSYDVPFGQKQKAFEVSKRFEAFSQELGFPKGRTLVGSIGAPESRVETEYVFASMAALEATWAKLNHPRMADFQRELAPFIVPGSHRWEIWREQQL
jgi:hypothetical protein